MPNDVIVSLDIGTSQIRTMVAEVHADSSYYVIGIGTAPSVGIKRGSIIDIDQVSQAILKSVADAERMVDLVISDVYVGFTGSHVTLQNSRGVVAVSSENREISYKDIERVIQAARAIALPPDREIIEVTANQFVVDGFDGIKDPHGMVGVRLEVEATIIAGSKTVVHNITRCINKAGLNLVGMVYLPPAIGEFCLSEDEKNLGIVLVDIGGGTTTISFFKQGSLQYTAVLPIGGEYITNDISIGFKTETDCAEQMKCKYGVASAEYASASEMMKVRTIGERKECSFSQVELAHIIEPRLIEMFHLIQADLKEAGVSSNDLPGGYVLTGGVMSTSQIVEVARKRLGCFVRVSLPQELAVKDPSYIGGLAMINYLHKNNFKYRFIQGVKKSGIVKKRARNSFFKRFKIWLSEII